MSVNSLVRGTEQARRPVGPAVSVLVAAVCLGAGQVIGWFVLRGTGFDSGSDAGLITSCLAAFLPTLVLMGLWVGAGERRPLWTLGFRSASPVRTAFLGAGTALAFLVLLSVAGSVVGRSGQGDDDTGSPALGVGLLLLAAFAVQASTEEVVFRGFLLPRFTARWGVTVGVLGSSALFAAAHLINLRAPSTYIAMTFLLGVALALWALADGALWRTCAFHTVWNWLPHLLGGSDDGTVAEATTATTVASFAVLALVVLGALWSFRRSPRGRTGLRDLQEEQA
ncbi:CPBP family intramembrane metalloprotease [Streptomyces sp. OUCMDZ-4982]|uniref:CPBP family intramembrane glutamic endopeptidase n=1 Tax=Streptomyces sp. OUCMDZ-4982 TaxID=2973090 RepID=UPI00215C92A7|nr:type II CAAX endopeptidase family protein [Streptomyces sp. OUCMDZ-4982]MCR8946518.1 CPBP family intramembrane metalloprotease [Streptomyces sp. OUCMDZ-4982]